jgi:hypothetical protein
VINAYKILVLEAEGKKAKSKYECEDDSPSLTQPADVDHSSTLTMEETGSSVTSLYLTANIASHPRRR